tara:strand:- start:520 stop:825 length:306 start_codon:yes stop_codon:yes gene_type:complete
MYIKLCIYKLDAIENIINKKELEKFINELDQLETYSKNDEFGAKVCFEISQIFLIMGDSKESDSYQKMAKKKILNQASMIKDEKERDSFLSSRRIIRNISD